MGKISFQMLGLVTGAFLSASALAQTTRPPTLQAPVLDLRTLRLSQSDAELQTGVIDFENVQGPSAGAGVLLTDQYLKSHGVSFGPGASVHFCARVTDDVNASLCPYRAAASGARAAAHDVRAGGPAMTIKFSRPVDAVSMRINPTGGALNEVFTVQLSGLDANGRRVAANDTRFTWGEAAFTWPTSVALETSGAGFAQVTVEMRRVAQNNQPVRFLIDDVSLAYSAQTGDAPVLAALNEARNPPRIEGAEVVQSDEDQEMREELRLYPAAMRVRTAIDWDAVETSLERQKDLGFAAAAHDDAPIVDIAELPLLLPSRADAASLSIAGGRDSYQADFAIGGRGYSLYGTRVLTIINPAPGAPAPASNVTMMETDYALIASFSLYGASYTLTRYCRNDSADEDPACHDRDALGAVAREMVVAVGAAGRERP